MNSEPIGLGRAGVWRQLLTSTRHTLVHVHHAGAIDQLSPAGVIHKGSSSLLHCGSV